MEAVDYIVISRGFNDVNKVGLTEEQTEEQTEAFVNKWNRSRSKGPYKFIPEYWLTVCLKDGKMRDFRVNGKLVKEGNDWSYSVGDAEFFERMVMEE